MTRALTDRSRASFVDLDNIELRTVGIDIGSSTSHLTFSEIHLQRLSDRLSSRYVPVERRIVHESEIVLTPYLPDYTIDAVALGDFVARAYATAGIDRHDIDSGAVILTGEATKRLNAAAISERLAAVAGEFVCATAGHRLEAIIAAHGSGAVAESRERGNRVLNVDVGGGTTKFTLIEDGMILDAGAIAVGGRLVATDAGRIHRLEPAAGWFSRQSGVDVQLGGDLDEAGARRLARAMADVVVGYVRGEALDPALWLTPPLDIVAPDRQPDALSFSGGVAEYIHRRQLQSFGDLGLELGLAIRTGLEDAALWQKVLRPRETIRATVIGASQYTVQVSGDTVSVSSDAVLPVHNVKVVPGPSLPEGPFDAVDLGNRLRRALEASDVRLSEAVALAFNWSGRPFYPRLRAVAQAITDAVLPGSGQPLVVIFDSDVARSVGDVMRKELGWQHPLVCLDGITVGEFDFVDVGARLEPSGAHPVVVKSLVFPGAAPQ